MKIENEKTHAQVVAAESYWLTLDVDEVVESIFDIEKEYEFKPDYVYRPLGEQQGSLSGKPPALLELTPKKTTASRLQRGSPLQSPVMCPKLLALPLVPAF
eukprot:8259013-Karenia_brevis.AAC.1